MIDIKRKQRYCKEPLSNIENYDKAVSDTTQTWDLHHKLEIELGKSWKQLIKENLYYDRPANELIFLTRNEHMRLHLVGKAPWNKGKIGVQVAWNKGISPSPETKKKISEATRLGMKSVNLKGRILVTNGIIIRRIFPNELDNYLSLGFHRGRK